MSRLGVRAFLALAAGALGGIAACAPGGGAQDGPAWPEGTVVAVDDLPILAEQIDAEIEPFLVFEPHSTDDHVRRLAFAHVVLPRAVARLRAEPGAYEAARAEAEAFAAHVATRGEPPPDGPGEFVAEGGPRQLGWATWMAGLGLEPGEWSGAVAAPHEFRVVRVVRREEGPTPAQLFLELAVVPFSFLPDDLAPGPADELYPDHRLTIVDPAWRAIVPEWIQYAMHVHDDPGGKPRNVAAPPD